MESVKEALEKLKEAMVKDKSLYHSLKPIYNELKTSIESSENWYRLETIFIDLDIEDIWSRLGIPTRYESKICLALYLFNELSPTQLHEKTGVPLPKVYQTVKKLKDSDIVQETGERGEKRIKLVSSGIENELQKYVKK
jgi:DNA-binding transcriptional regulator GbsR (MarR family)